MSKAMKDFRFSLISAFHRLPEDVPWDSPTPMIPDSVPTMEAVAAEELFVASELRRAANSRYDVACLEALKHGILRPDEQYDQGFSEVVWSQPGAGFLVFVRRDQDTEMLSTDKVKQILIREFGVQKAYALLDEAKKGRKGKTIVSCPVV